MSVCPLFTNRLPYLTQDFKCSYPCARFSQIVCPSLTQGVVCVRVRVSVIHRQPAPLKLKNLSVRVQFSQTVRPSLRCHGEHRISVCLCYSMFIVLCDRGFVGFMYVFVSLCGSMSIVSV